MRMPVQKWQINEWVVEIMTTRTHKLVNGRYMDKHVALFMRHESRSKGVFSRPFSDINVHVLVTNNFGYMLHVTYITCIDLNWRLMTLFIWSPKMMYQAW